MSKFSKDMHNILNNNAPDLANSIKSSIDWESVRLKNERENKTLRERFSFKKIFAIAMPIVAVVLAIVLVALLVPSPMNSSDDYVVTLSVNPSVAFSVNSEDKVINTKALNEDGAKVLFGENYIGLDYMVATEKFINRAVELGMISEGDNIKISVNNKNNKHSYNNSKADELNKYLSDNLSGYNFSKLTEEELENIYDHIDDFDEDAFTEETFNKLLTEINFELDKKEEWINRLINILKSVVNNGKQEDLVSDIDKKLFLENLLAYRDHYNVEDLIEDYDYAILTYGDIREILGDVLLDNLEDIVECREEIQEITYEDIDESFKERIQDLLEIAFDDIFEKD